jgi:copper chaperone
MLTTRATTGVKAHKVDLEGQTATVIGKSELDYLTVLKTIKKTGKKVNTGEADGKEESVDIPEA